MKKGALIIDISCDRNGGIETSVPTTIENPTYVVDEVTHYVVDHTPSLFYKSTSEAISEQVCSFLDDIISEQRNIILDNATIIANGKIIDKRIIAFQNR